MSDHKKERNDMDDMDDFMKKSNSAPKMPHNKSGGRMQHRPNAMIPPPPTKDERVVR